MTPCSQLLKFVRRTVHIFSRGTKDEEMRGKCLARSGFLELKPRRECERMGSFSRARRRSPLSQYIRARLLQIKHCSKSDEVARIPAILNAIHAIHSQLKLSAKCR